MCSSLVPGTLSVTMNSESDRWSFVGRIFIKLRACRTNLQSCPEPRPLATSCRRNHRNCSVDQCFGQYGLRLHPNTFLESGSYGTLSVLKSARGASSASSAAMRVEQCIRCGAGEYEEPATPERRACHQKVGGWTRGEKSQDMVSVHNM